jgi:hypothetical protein
MAEKWGIKQTQCGQFSQALETQEVTQVRITRLTQYRGGTGLIEKANTNNRVLEVQNIHLSVVNTVEIYATRRKDTQTITATCN